jgi:hypothetical protein
MPPSIYWMAGWFTAPTPATPETPAAAIPDRNEAGRLLGVCVTDLIFVI